MLLFVTALNERTSSNLSLVCCCCFKSCHLRDGCGCHLFRRCNIIGLKPHSSFVSDDRARVCVICFNLSWISISRNH